jgi:hypothetical protein
MSFFYFYKSSPEYATKDHARFDFGDFVGQLDNPHLVNSTPAVVSRVCA